MDAAELRKVFTDFFVARGHVALPPASLVPNDPTVLFTIAGMVQFKPYFRGDAEPPAPRVTTVQPCLRTVDIELVGTTPRHCTFFEMLGNFSFGDYFKLDAIAWAWEFVTEVLGFDPERLWATVHQSDDEAAAIWPASTSLPAERLQRLGDDNFWKMGETGPCGPSSEIFFDRGEAYGPGGGPAVDGSDRYSEIWNLVFLQYDRGPEGSLAPLPKACIDTGAGLDRLLAVLESVPDVQAIDEVAPIVARAGELTGTSLGVTEESDISLRVIADHSRAATFAAADGVFPSNDGRGYVLRRLIRRVVLRSHRLGRDEPIMAELVEAVAAAMGGAYPYLGRDVERISKVAQHEEEAFLHTLRQGTALLSGELAGEATKISGSLAFRLHDTYGFPFELTKEEALARGVEVDEAGFEAEMSAQRHRAREATKALRAAPEEAAASFRRLRGEHGATRFLGYEQTSSVATTIGVLPSTAGWDFENADGDRAPTGAELIEVFLDQSPFYAEGGGQVGDTGTITSATGRMRVLDTTNVAEGLFRHLGYMEAGELQAGMEAVAEIDLDRRQAIRRNHTGTHLLHAALRSVLGDHVRQRGSLVAGDRLRFDFSHFGPLDPSEVAAIEDRVNNEVLSDVEVLTIETSRAEAEELGAIAFFGDRYGERVRMVQAGPSSLELCGGTHVSALGMIGPLSIVSEGSIGANTRRLECFTGTGALASFRLAERSLLAAADLLRTGASELPGALRRLLDRHRDLERELAELRRRQLVADAAQLAAASVDHGVVARRDGLEQLALRELALLVRDRPGVDAVALVGAPGDGRAAVVVAVKDGAGLDARHLAAEAGRLGGGGGGGSAELATAGGRSPASIDAAVERLRHLVSSREP